MRRISMAIAISTLIALLEGCASTKNVGDQVVKANLGQEDAHNRLVFLNIMRAYHRMPMHFSKITAVRMPLGVGNPTFTIPTPWGPDFREQIYSFQTQIAIQQGVDSTPQESQEFMRGIMTPVSVNTLLYYLDQGWPQQLVLHLFVKSIEVYEGEEKLVERYNNYPPNADEFRKFQTALTGLKGCEIDAKPDGKKIPYGPMYQPTALGTADALAAAKTAGLALLPVDSDGKDTKSKSAGYRLFREVSFTSLQLSQSKFEVDKCVGPGDTMRATVQSESLRGPAPGSTKSAVFVLRSPEAMVYYLGELARAQIEGQVGASAGNGQFRPTIGYRSARAGSAKEPVVLFRVDRGASPSAALSVEYANDTYSIPPASATDRSVHVLSLVTQLLNLHNKGSDAPATTNVRVVQ